MDAPAAATAKPSNSSPVRYLVVWGALLALTAATYLTAKVDLGGSWNLLIALVIASAKATLVVLFFMHLWDSSGMNRMVFVVSLFFVLLLLGGIVGDVATRFRLALPPEASGLAGDEPAGPGRGPEHGVQNKPVR